MIRVLIVDDSRVVQILLSHILESDAEIQVIGTVSDGKEALAFVERQKPDIITMDIHMPEMDGYDATRRIMESTPVPIIIISSTWEPRDQASSFKALEAGALVCLPKPPSPGHPDYAKALAEIIATVKQMAEVKVIRRWPKHPPSPAVPLPAMPFPRQPVQIVAIGASTGGPTAIQQLLAALPADFPVPILIVQHIAHGFARGFVDWLNTVSSLPVYLATNHEPIWKGRAYVAPDDLQMGVADGGRILLSHAPPEHFLRPSASYLLRSVAETYGQAAVGILMSGMGKDGSAELKLIKDAGGITFAQDKESSVVHGMPGEAIRLGAANHVFPPVSMAAALVQMTRPPPSARDSDGARLSHDWKPQGNLGASLPSRRRAAQEDLAAVKAHNVPADGKSQPNAGD
jgi:two-component system chemotaxis response regulator CheB